MNWPALRRYEGSRRRAISLPVGGIGTGTIGFGGRGQLRDWEIENHPSKGLSAQGTFLACRVAEEGLPADAFVLEGELFPEEVEGALGSPVPVSGMKRFRECVFETTYPFGRVLLRDEHAPVRAVVDAWNPLVPGDADASGLPLAVLEVTLESLRTSPIEATIMLSLEDLVGHRLRTPHLTAGGSEARIERRGAAGVTGVLLGDDGMDRDDEEWGTIAAAVMGESSFAGARWSLGRWNQGLTSMWEGLLASGEPAQGVFRPAPGEPQNVCLGARRTVPPLGTVSVRFILVWHFPNRRAWTFSGPGPRGSSTNDIVGNYYCNGFQDAWQALETITPRLDQLCTDTTAFVEAFCASDLAPDLKEAALFNLSTLRSQTVFRTADGYPYGWEGTLDDAGSCPGSCTHVWNYEYATPFVFPEVARKMREIEFLHATSRDGAMSFRVLLPLATHAQSWGLAAADGQYGCIIKLHREWRSSGDEEFLRLLWPACRRALEFSWLPGSWDADVDGVAEGCLHNTMDVEYYGPTAIIQSWYLGALAAAAEMATALGDSDLADRCRDLRARGARWTEEHLYNGAYYTQEIRPPKDFSALRPEVRHPDMGAQQTVDPEFQVGDGCQIDQLAGDVAAIVAGLGSSFAPEHVLEVMRSIHRMNFVSRFGWWKNYMRTFVTNADEGHIMLAYPNQLPTHPMPYWSEVMTGFEYTYTLGLVYSGLSEFAGTVVSMIRRRYDGELRNPFDEAECGHHYARAMAAWGLVHAVAGVDYDGRDASLRLREDGPGGRWFWAVNGAWGSLTRSGGSVKVDVRGGNLEVVRVLVGERQLELDVSGTIGPGSSVNATER